MPFFFDLVETKLDKTNQPEEVVDSTELDTSDEPEEIAAFGSEGPASDADENRIHHPYFLAEVKKLVDSATAAGIHIQQRVHWSYQGHWLRLDDGKSAGV